MISRHAGLGLLLAALSVTPLARGEAKADAAQAAERDARSSEQRARILLRETVAQKLAAQPPLSLEPYTVSASLVQLRRYVGPGKRLRLVCVVDLAVLDRQGALVAMVRGSATTTGATQNEAVQAAAHSAIDRLPAAVHALSKRRDGAGLARAFVR